MPIFANTPLCRIVLILGTLPALFHLPTQADASPDPVAVEAGKRDTLELDPSSARMPAQSPLEGGKVVLIPSDEDRLTGNLGDFLERLAGVNVVRTGGLGDYLGVSIWGSSERQVNIYVNGILQNQASDPSQSLGDWDLARVEKVEVHKGFAPENLPGAPMGGSINILTRQDLHGAKARGALGTGSFGSLRANGSVDYRGDHLGAHAQVIRNQSRGDFTYFDDGGTEFKKGRYPDGAPRLGADDLIQKERRNNAHAYSGVNGDVSLLLSPSAEAGVQAELTQLHKDIPSPYANLDASVPVSAFRNSGKYSGRGYGKWVTPDQEASLDLSGNLIRDAYVDTAGGRGTVGVGYDNELNEYADGLATLTGRKTLGPGFSLSSLLSYGISGYLYTDRLADKSFPWLLRYTGEAKLSPSYVQGRHAWQAVLSITQKLQEYYGPQAYTYGGAQVPREDWDRHWALRGGYQYRPRKWARLFAQGGSSYRIPTFLEQFGDRGTLLANPTLRPEEGFNASLGLHFQVTGAALDLQGFAIEGKDIITLIQNSQSVLLYANTGATRIQGWEARLTADPLSWTRTDLDVTVQKAINLSGGSQVDDFKALPYRPVTQASFRQAFLYYGWTFSMAGYYRGRAYPNPSNRPSLFDSYSHNTDWQSRWDMGLSWRRKHFLAALNVHNATDERNFDFFNFPLPGRSYMISAQVDL